MKKSQKSKSTAKDGAKNNDGTKSEKKSAKDNAASLKSGKKSVARALTGAQAEESKLDVKSQAAAPLTEAGQKAARSNVDPSATSSKKSKKDKTPSGTVAGTVSQAADQAQEERKEGEVQDDDQAVDVDHNSLLAADKSSKQEDVVPDDEKNAAATLLPATTQEQDLLEQRNDDQAPEGSALIDNAADDDAEANDLMQQVLGNPNADREPSDAGGDANEATDKGSQEGEAAGFDDVADASEGQIDEKKSLDIAQAPLLDIEADLLDNQSAEQKTALPLQANLDVDAISPIKNEFDDLISDGFELKHAGKDDYDIIRNSQEFAASLASAHDSKSDGEAKRVGFDVDQQSVNPLTLKDGVDYEDAKFTVDIDIEGNQNFDDVPSRAGSLGRMSDDEPQESKAQKTERQEQVREDYLQKFRKEVDFHHRVAYRFEKAYRLGKKQPEKLNKANQEIMKIITEHDDYIKQDPMALFYCLYFCVYYNNPVLVDFVRNIFIGLPQEDRLEQIADIVALVDDNKLEKLRTVGEQVNTLLYHMVLYQAVDDDLRVVYSQIIRRLKAVQMRDIDALQLLRNRDYELIQVTFDKATCKVRVGLGKDTILKSYNYRKYDQAYYEEMVIDYALESRITLNFRDRFLATREDINIIIEMYARNDYVSHFLKILDPNETSHQQFCDLFMVALKNDAYKTAIQIYLRYLAASDITVEVMDAVIDSLMTSINFHEMKLFFIHAHFDVLTIQQMNNLVEAYLTLVHRKEHRRNPMLSQLNTMKVALLIYRISWKIESRKIYSLITKCTLLNQYIMKSIVKYLQKQQHISQLYKLMREPIFHLTEKKDSLDIMLEMGMDDLLKHPVIVEVLNLVYEGKYSVDSSIITLSQTFSAFANMETTDIKSINQRMISNVTSLGQIGGSRQVSLQFNIWKQCIEQREQDEMLFTVLANLIMLIICASLNATASPWMMEMKLVFGSHFLSDPAIFSNAPLDQQTKYCGRGLDQMLQLARTFNLFNMLVAATGFGFLASVIQKVTIYRVKENVSLPLAQFFLEFCILITSSIQYARTMTPPPPTGALISDTCSSLRPVPLTSAEIKDVTMVYGSFRIVKGDYLSIRMLASLLVVQYSVSALLMLQRTQSLGSLIMMVGHMTTELGKFAMTFFLLFALSILAGRQLNQEVKKEYSDFWQNAVDVFEAFGGHHNFEDYTEPQGQFFVVALVFLFHIVLFSFLVSMFINKMRIVKENEDALRRMNVIKAKNMVSYDSALGAITITFFPISIVMLPFLLPLTLLRSERLSEIVLKVQYAFMVSLYVCIALTISIPMLPILLLKSIGNSLYIARVNKREDYKGQNLVNVLLAVFAGPFVIIASLLTDLLALPNLLMKDESDFEYKYQQSLDNMSREQKVLAMKVFYNTYYTSDFATRFQEKSMTIMELMVMHRRIFQISDNLHDLCCRGTKDYRESLSTVEDYNLTKILTRKCCVPDLSGDVKLSRCDFNIIGAVQMDIEMYNYVDMILKDHDAGKMTYENLMKEKAKVIREEDERMNNLDKTVKHMGAGRVYMTEQTVPPGTVLLRSNDDVMNNYFVKIIALSFTTIEEQIQAILDNKELIRQRKQLQEADRIKDKWTNALLGESNKFLDDCDATVNEFRGVLNTRAMRVEGQH